MIRANRQLIPDRKLFNNFLKLRNISIECSPHQQYNLEEISIMFNNFLKLFDEKLMKMEQKVEYLYQQLKRVNAIIKFKNEKKLFSFANSPNSKSVYIFPQSAEKYKKSEDKFQYQYDTAQSGSRIKTKSQFSTSNAKKEQNYFDEERNALKKQIIQLKNQLFKVHHWDNDEKQNQNCTSPKQYIENHLQSSKKVNYGKQEQVWQHQQIYPFDYNVEGSQLVERCKAIIKQYQKQEEILRPMANKAEKYKNGLEEVLKWLRNLKQFELKKFLPCQHCEMKQHLIQYFNKQPLLKTTKYPQNFLHQLHRPRNSQQKTQSERDSNLIDNDIYNQQNFYD